MQSRPIKLTSLSVYTTDATSKLLSAPGQQIVNLRCLSCGVITPRTLWKLSIAKEHSTVWRWVVSFSWHLNLFGDQILLKLGFCRIGCDNKAGNLCSCHQSLWDAIIPGIIPNKAYIKKCLLLPDILQPFLWRLSYSCLNPINMFYYCTNRKIASSILKWV